MIGTEVSRAYYDPALNAAMGVFVGYLSPDEFKTIANELLKIQVTKKVNKQINNVKQMKVLKQEVQVWLNDVWFPQAQKNGLKYFAFVLADDIFGKLSTEGANKDASNKFGMEIQNFNTLEDAKQWLNTKR